MANEIHSLMKVAVHESGAEEWRCAECGQHFVMQWKPEYQRVFLCAGDESAIHNTSKGAMVVHRPQAEDPWLAPWQQWLDRFGDEQVWDD